MKNSIIMLANGAKQLGSKAKHKYWCLVVTGVSLFYSVVPVFATSGSSGTFWQKFTEIMKDVYTQILGVSTIIAVTAAAVALVIRLVSRNQRAVDEASSWLKRIVVTWVILNTLGFIVAYLQPLVDGGQYTP